MSAGGSTAARHWLLLAACGLAACAPTPRPAPPPPEIVEPAPPEPAAPPPPVARPCRQLSIAAVGDIMLGTDYPEDRLPPDDGRGLLAEVAPVLRAADVAFGNLEGVLMDGGEPVKQCRDPSVCYLFRSPTRYAITLREAGFDVMSLANNHARDFGEAGRTASMAALDAAGIRHSGRIGDIASWEQDGLSLALVAFSFTGGAYSHLDEDAAAAEVAALAAAHDLVIVSFHGGAEGGDADRLPFGRETAFGEDRGDLVRFAHAVVDAGADLVIGHGPHVPRALEIYRERLVAYSLGNFATYWGISIQGNKGLAPILVASLDELGRFLGGHLHSGIQSRPDGVRLHPPARAFARMRELTQLDFPDGTLEFEATGRIKPARPVDPSCPVSP